MTDTFASALDRLATAHTPARRQGASRPRYSLAALRGMVESWEERKRFRLKLADMLKVTPHLIEDIGLTRKLAESEIAKPFWRE